MKEFNYEELMKILNDNKQQDIEKVQEAYKEKFQDVKDCAVLGIDIYRYGSMNEDERNIVPFVAQILRDTAIKYCLAVEKFLFQGRNETYFKANFINTGDGGYFIFETPLHAFVFAIYFETIVRLFNSYELYPELRKMLTQRPTLRYVMTYNKIYKYEQSHYGPGIIMNARILSKDKLDRFIIDEKTYEWFMQNVHGIDNLPSLVTTDITQINAFKTYGVTDNHNAIFSPSKASFLRAVYVQKIGEIKAKPHENGISVYNLYVQAFTNLGQEDKKLTVSLGNLNVSGISDE